MIEIRKTEIERKHILISTLGTIVVLSTMIITYCFCKRCVIKRCARYPKQQKEQSYEIKWKKKTDCPDGVVELNLYGIENEYFKNRINFRRNSHRKDDRKYSGNPISSSYTDADGNIIVFFQLLFNFDLLISLTLCDGSSRMLIEYNNRQ